MRIVFLNLDQTGFRPSEFRFWEGLPCGFLTINGNSTVLADFSVCTDPNNADLLRCGYLEKTVDIALWKQKPPSEIRPYAELIIFFHTTDNISINSEETETIFCVS